MERKVAWNRPTPQRNGEPLWTSKCGRYTIAKRHYASARNGHFNNVAYQLTVLATSQTETLDSLRDAKDEAEMDHDPNWEPS